MTVERTWIPNTLVEMVKRGQTIRDLPVDDLLAIGDKPNLPAYYRTMVIEEITRRLRGDA